MESLKIIDRKVRYMAMAGALVLATVIPAIASAAQVTERSIEMSSSATAATGVTYKVNFTPVGSAVAAVLEFCSNTPLIGEACTAPTGFSVSSATVAGFTKDAASTANRLVLTTGTITAATNPAITVSGVTNPTTAGAFYARIVTYSSNAGAQAYTPTSVGTHVDDGSVALSATSNIGVSGAVLETMTFCVSGGTGDPLAPTNPITASCGGTLVPPTLKLGKDVGGVIALDSLDIYTGKIFTQISTNASKGAVVSLKSSAINCGGLLRSSDPTACNIGPAGTSGTVAAGEAEFGLKLDEDVVDATNGDFVAASAVYNSTDYRMNYVSGNATGVTSTYGDPILDTNEKPANNRDMGIKFAASVTNNTPAGNYSADLSLIATGKF